MEKFLYQKINKEPKINVWFAFPAIESFSLSSLGYLSIFKALDLNKDIYVEKDISGRSLNSQFKYANKKNAKYCLTIGDEEVERKTAKIKEMQTGEEQEIKLEVNSIVEKIR